MLDPERARTFVQSLVQRATDAGASAVDALYAGDRSSSVSVRMGELEGVSRSEGERISLRVIVGQRSATIGSSDLSEDSMATLVERGMAMARLAPEDPYVGLAPEDLLATGALPEIDSDDSVDPDPAELRARALAAEAAALAVPGIKNSGGAGAGASGTAIALATSTGFVGAYRASGHSHSVSVIAGEGAGMERDHAWHSARFLEDLEAAEDVGRRAGERAVARLGSTRPKPGRYPVLFDPRVSSGLLGHLSSAISGASIARRTSFLLDRLGDKVFRGEVTIVDDPLRPRGLRSRRFDGEGVRVARRELVSGGTLNQWIAESASARQLGIAPTGHATRGGTGAPGVGPSNLYLKPGRRSREELLARFPEAILVVELIGQGVNGVTGDYSKGAAGFMVRDGAIAEPVSEITIASNLIDMFATMKPASDLEFRKGIDAPTVLIPEMTVAAA